MKHPFTKIFEKALKKSTKEENVVLLEAQKIIQKGYSKVEVARVLDTCIKGRLDDTEVAVLTEALDVLNEVEETF